MNSPLLILVLSFVLLLALNVPVAVSVGLATFFTSVLVMGSVPAAASLVAQQIATGIDSFSLLAIPFFILSGLFMGRGGLARRLIDFAQAIVGRLPGGLACVNVITCMLFGAISGSAAAAVSSVGGFMIPEMTAKGYDRRFSVALTTTAATTGLLIPPSNIMIVYALVSGGSVSIAALFVAGILPGLLIGILLLVVGGWISLRRGYGRGTRSSWHLLVRTFNRAVLSLLLVVIVVGGILKGIFTPTEAAAIAVAYAFLLTVVLYREVKLNDLPGILLQAGITTSVVFLLIGTSMAMSWILTLEEIPQRVAASLAVVSQNKLLLFLIINLVLLAAGTVIDMTPAVLIFTPIFWPLAQEAGMDPVHFGIMLIANLCIGLCTPPVGACLFVGCSVGQTSLARVTPALLPFFVAMLGGLALITSVPALSLWLPRLFGLAP